MQKDELKDLLARYRSGAATPDEKAFLETWYLQHQGTPTEDYPLSHQVNDAAAIWDNMQRDYEKRTRVLPWSRIAAAAILLIAIAFGLYFYNVTGKTQSGSIASKVQETPVPGKNNGTLILADGRRISLADAKDGEIARQSGIIVTKSANGQLVYTVAEDSQSERPLGLNTIETPRGGQYQVRLPDGTQVWLNAASSLRYPATFSPGMERKVELTGEAYFEVAKDKSRPFRVVSAHQTVEVLGTHFSVSAYSDDANTITTLSEGSVKISAMNAQNIIKPGEQTILTQGQIHVQTADLDEALAWKNGYFRFNDEKIGDVMRKLARWYDVDVQFEGTPTDEGFNGVISRSKSLSQVLKMLEKTKAIHFNVSGRRITVR